MAPPAPTQRPATLGALEQITEEIREGQVAVAALAEERKRIIRALDASGIDYKEMAGAMGVTVATVYRIAPKAKRQ